MNDKEVDGYKEYARVELKRLSDLMPEDKCIHDWTKGEKQAFRDFSDLAHESIRRKNTSHLCKKCNDNMWYGIEHCQSSSPLGLYLYCDCGHSEVYRLPNREMNPKDIVIGYKDDE